tara:strand:+ start:11073 stop:11261 length:189 start_codon:yes stop_codon:yes gene_type:complete
MTLGDYLNDEEGRCIAQLRNALASALSMRDLFKENGLSDDAYNWSAVVGLLEQAVARFGDPS